MTSASLIAFVLALDAMLNQAPTPVAVIPAAPQLDIQRVEDDRIDCPSLVLADSVPPSLSDQRFRR